VCLAETTTCIMLSLLIGVEPASLVGAAEAVHVGLHAAGGVAWALCCLC
jgi:hypothetical protein